MSPSQQTVQQWIVFLHDVAKEPVGGRDHRHSFRSAAHAGRIMPQLGFPVTAAYTSEFQNWFNLTDTATLFDEAQDLVIQDNSKLPRILDGVKRIFAEPTRTAVSVITLHQSITSLAAWPVKAQLTIRILITPPSRGQVSQRYTSFSWRLGSDFYLRTAWTRPAAASFSLDLFVNKQLRPEY